MLQVGDVAGLTAAIDRAVLEMSLEQRRLMEDRAREHAMSFDRTRVFDNLFAPLPVALPDRHGVPVT